MPQKSQAAGRRVVKAFSKSTMARTKLQFLLDIAHATFAQPGPPTKQQVEALKQTLSAVPLEELGLRQQSAQQQRQAGSSSSSRSSSPGLSDGTHALLAGELERQRQQHGGEGGGGGGLGCQPRPPITYLLIYEDERVSMGIFCLPARAKIPLHNHPGMTVLSRVLYGEMHVASYDWAEGGAAGAAQLPREARAVLDASRTAADEPVVLFPRAGGNIHEFTAVTDCAVLDLMSPPYSTEDGRDCTYYAVLPGGASRPGLVRLDAFEPPLDFVINQGQYCGVTPRRRPALLDADSGGEGCGSGGGGLTEQAALAPSSPVGSPASPTSHSDGAELSDDLDRPSQHVET